MADSSSFMAQNLLTQLSSWVVMKASPSLNEAISYLAKGRKLILDILDTAITAHAAFAPLRTELHQLNEEKLSLTALVNLLRAQSLPEEGPVNPEENLIPENPISRNQKSKHFAVPPVFSSHEKSELGPFPDQLKIKFFNNADSFPTIQSRLWYTVIPLSHSALTQIRPYIKATGINLLELTRFHQLLKNAFGDPDTIATAIRELDNL